MCEEGWGWGAGLEKAAVVAAGWGWLEGWPEGLVEGLEEGWG